MTDLISIVCEDVLTVSCDVLVLKHAQGFYGADWAVARHLGGGEDLHGIPTPQPGARAFLDTGGKIGAREVLFLGVPPLHRFEYEEIRTFAARALMAAAERPQTRKVAMTIHGVGYGLDERETFLAQLAGIVETLQARRGPANLEQILFVEKNRSRAQRLSETLAEHAPLLPMLSKPSPSLETGDIAPQESPGSNGRPCASRDPALTSAGKASGAKPHVFVAMPFDTHMEDVYTFGIQAPVHAAGFLCERVDMAVFSGDILARILQRIETADLVIADLTGANANVYLEVGYAWGRGRRTVLLAPNIQVLTFDVKGQRCIIYRNITDLNRKLTDELAAIAADR